MGNMKNFILSGEQRRQAKYSKEKKTTAAISTTSIIVRATGYSFSPYYFEIFKQLLR